VSARRGRFWWARPVGSTRRDSKGFSAMRRVETAHRNIPFNATSPLLIVADARPCRIWRWR